MSKNMGKYQDISVKSQPRIQYHRISSQNCHLVHGKTNQTSRNDWDLRRGSPLRPWRMALTSGIGFPSYAKISVERSPPLFTANLCNDLTDDLTIPNI